MESRDSDFRLWRNVGTQLSNKMHYVYFLQSTLNGRYYVGITNDVTRRLKEHNSGMVRSTVPYLPWELKKTEKYANISQARRREQFIKAKHSRIIIEKILAG